MTKPTLSVLNTSLTCIALVVATVGYGHSKNDLIQLQQVTSDSLKVAGVSAATDLKNCQTQMVALDASVDRKEFEAASTKQELDRLKSHSLKLEAKVSRLVRSEQDMSQASPAVDVSSVTACTNYLKGKTFVGKHWDGDLYLNFGQNGVVSVTQEQCGEWEHKKHSELGGQLNIDPDLSSGKHARKISFGSDSWALLCSDGNIIWRYGYGNIFMQPNSDLLSLPGQSVEIEGVFIDAGGNDDVGEKLMFIINASAGYERYVFEDATYYGELNYSAVQQLYIDRDNGPPTYAPNLSMIGKRFILTIARGEAYPEYDGGGEEPESYPADEIVGVRAIE